MKNISKLALAAAFVFVGLQSTANALEVTTSQNNVALNLTNSLLGPGINLIGTPTYTGAAEASGLFVNGFESGIGIESGILLTTGGAKLAEGPNQADDTTVDNDLAGDSDLDNLITESSTYDASVLEFRFTTTTVGNLTFNYVFASEEYNEYVNEAYNDVFGFFLDGVNIALVPGTEDAVSVNTINNGPDGDGEESSNPHLYNDNTFGLYDLEYDGFTDVLTVQALGLSAGEHTIKIAIADAGDWDFDSGVFIQAGSFVPAPEPSSLMLGALALSGALGLRKRKK